MSPTERSLKLLRSWGFIPAIVETWIPKLEIRKDLWGFGDLLAVHPRDKVFLIVQATSAANVSARLKKARGKPELTSWLKAGGAFEVWGWSKRGERWIVRRVGVKVDNLEPVELTPKRPRGRRMVQEGLFDG